VVRPEIEASGAAVHRRGFTPADLDGAWLAVAAATPEVNREVAAAAEARRIFLNAVDDPAHASAYTGGILRRGGVLVAVSTEGRAPALAGLLREALDTVLPEDLERWVEVAERLRVRHKAQGVPMEYRRPLLLAALQALYEGKDGAGAAGGTATAAAAATAAATATAAAAAATAAAAGAAAATTTPTPTATAAAHREAA
jgi:uroporphyrin-III C-methyltransferase/precorrin-2 dehydrogenase/sirohydrochlorin ferrochelatase